MILRFSQKLGSRLKTGTLKPLPMDAASLAGSIDSSAMRSHNTAVVPFNGDVNDA